MNSLSGSSTMRERLAEILAILSAVIVVILAAMFSLLHNFSGLQDTSIDVRLNVPQAQSLSRVVAGRAIYHRLGCSGCHAIGGEGNPRVPLDDVSKRRSSEEMRDWIVAANTVRQGLSASVVRMKQSYVSMSEEEMQALLDYLTSF